MSTTKAMKTLSQNSNTLFDYLQKSKYNFQTQDTNVETLYNKYKNGRMDLDPQHQRNVVHSDAWQSNVVESLLTGRPIAPPEFDTYVKNARRTWRSLDGKQRMCAIMRYVNNEYKFKTSNENLIAMHNKKFDDLDENIRDLILDKKFEIKVTDSTLSEEELAAHFRIKQETMKTSAGEKLHCLARNDATKVVYKLLEVNKDCLDDLYPNDTRMQREESAFRMIYGVYAYINKQIMDPKISQIVDCFEKNKLGFALNDDSTGVAIRLISYTYETIVNLKIQNKIKKSKTFMLPMLALFLEANQIDYFPSKDKVRKFLMNKLHDNYYDNVGGEHNATKHRRKILLEDFKNWMNNE